MGELRDDNSVGLLLMVGGHLEMTHALRILLAIEGVTWRRIGDGEPVSVSQRWVTVNTRLLPYLNSYSSLLFGFIQIEMVSWHYASR